MSQSDIGIWGLGVMGKNLALNIQEQGYKVSVYNRTVPGEERVVQAFMEENPSDGLSGYTAVGELVSSLRHPRTLLIMVKAGDPVDHVIASLLPHLQEGDILIDGGNSHFKDTNRRCEELKNQGIHFVGLGVSGGEEGARLGPSLMPGGAEKAWESVRPLLQAIAAKDFAGNPCCRWMGPRGAGHFVKMVHNGIEYAVMQLLAECYDVMRRGLAMDIPAVAHVFETWNDGWLSSYLVEITADIFTVREDDGSFLLEHILDAAGQKGTGRWTACSALELGVALPLITESVYSRVQSSYRDLRRQASEQLSGPDVPELLVVDTDELQQALLASVIVAYAEGFSLLAAANREWAWDIPLQTVAQVWKGGCIIRSKLLAPIEESYLRNSSLSHLLLAPVFREKLASLQSGWRKTISGAIQSGIPLPGISAALGHYDALRSGRLPANLIQAQRDYFGAHTYERTDQPRGSFFHTQWGKNS